MRDPKRIQAFCNRLARAWEMVPDLRFGQLMVNLFCEVARDPFYWEDDEMIQVIEGYVAKYGYYHAPGE